MNLIFGSVLIAVFLYYFFKMKRRRDIARKLQGPKTLPLIGSIEIVMVSVTEIFAYLREFQLKFKRYFKLWIGPELWVVVYDPKLIEQVLTDQSLEKSNDYNFLKPWLGYGLLTNEGKSWFVKRRAITPAFHFTILDNFIEIFENQADILIEKCNTTEIIDVCPLLLLCAFDIICETSMGFQMNAQGKSTLEYVQAVHNVTQICYDRMFNPFLQPEWIFWFLKGRKILYNSLKVIDKTTQQVINERRKLIENLEEEKTTTDTFNEDQDGLIYKSKNRKALLDTLLTATIDGLPLTDKEIKDEVNTFLFAGHDTTSSTLGFLLYSIAKYSDIQDKIYSEMQTELYENGSMARLNITKLNNLKYLDLVIKESMRIYTTVPFIGRQTVDNFLLDDILLPSNSNISLYLYGMFHDKDLFPDPERFIPERFEKSFTAEKFNPFSYIPFSAGHRNCIGQKFALLEMKTILVKILDKYIITLAYPEQELVLTAGLILKAEHGIDLTFENRLSN